MYNPEWNDKTKLTMVNRSLRLYANPKAIVPWKKLPVTLVGRIKDLNKTGYWIGPPLVRP